MCVHTYVRTKYENFTLKWNDCDKKGRAWFQHILSLGIDEDEENDAFNGLHLNDI